MGMLKEFRDFAIKGNVVELAVAVIIGAAFGAIVTSFVDDVITPLLLTPALKAAGVADISQLTWGAVKYGTFLSAVIKFIFVALVLFMMVKGINNMKKKEEAAAPAVTPEDIALLREIRDALKK
jgi:large conductance mechanosensitive channel